MVPLSSLLSILENEDDLSSLLPDEAPSVADLLDFGCVAAGVADGSSDGCWEALNKSSLNEYLRPMMAHDRFVDEFCSLTVTFGIHFAWIINVINIIRFFTALI